MVEAVDEKSSNETSYFSKLPISLFISFFFARILHTSYFNTECCVSIKLMICQHMLIMLFEQQGTTRHDRAQKRLVLV